MNEYAQIQEIEIAKIKIGSRQRDEIGDVIGLAENIKARGLLHPIIVDDDYNLCAGYRRLVAHGFLGRKTILARFWGTLNELERKQIELEENLKRKQLTWEEECKAIAELHELMQKLNPQPIQTAIRSGPGQPPKAWGLQDTADLLGQSIAKVSTDIALAKAMDDFPEIKKVASKTNAKRILRSKLELALLIEIQARQHKQNSLAPQGVVFQGDCTQSLIDMPADSIDLVITDPPWGINLTDNAREWIRSWNSFKDDEDSAAQATAAALKECYRAMKEGAHIYLFTSWHLLQFWQDYLVELGFWVRPVPLIWIKGNVTATQPYWKFMPKTECIIFAHKGTGGRTLAFPSSDVLQYDSPRDRIHPTQKPLDLLKYLISISSVEGEIVLDPFAGSGSTIKAAILTKRQGIGYEIDEEMTKRANNDILNVSDGQKESTTPTPS